VWGGDPSTTWDEDGLRASVTNGLTMGLSGVGIWGSDIGGFFTLTAPQLTTELLIRWIQFGAFSGVMRSQANGFGANDTRPQIFTDPVAPIWRRYAKLRTQLFPYLAASAEQYRATGMPIMRHHLLTDPGDAASGVDDQYRFGDWLLVAPILEPSATARAVVLPAGTWFDLTDDLVHDETTGAVSLVGSTVLGGDHTVTIEADLDQVPLMVEAGAVISLLPADVQTLADQHDTPEVVSHRDRANERFLLAFPRGRSEATIEPGETAVSVEDPATSWTLSVEGAPAGRAYRLTASMAGMEAPFEPCRATLGGVDLPAGAWSWDGGEQLFSADVELARGALVVEAC
jgi:alpha-glucosidase (family GH31 glycosyl hydrolase)